MRTLLSFGILKLHVLKMSLSQEHNTFLWSLCVLAGCMLAIKKMLLWRSEMKVPTVGVRSYFESGIFSNYRFYKDAEAVLLDGYGKVLLPICAQRLE